MIAFIRGVLAEAEGNTVVIDSDGIGYELTVPSSVMPKLPEIGDEVKLHTYLQVKEDGISLFGFVDGEDLQVFKMLIGVNGIGPKAAVGILSSLSADNLRFAVLAEDEKTLARAQGIGAKTAKKLILELKDKFRLEEVFEKKLLKTAGQRKAQAGQEAREGQGAGQEAQEGQSVGQGAQEQAIYEAIQALTALGFSSTEASKAVNGIEVSEGMSSDEVLKLALKNIHN